MYNTSNFTGYLRVDITIYINIRIIKLREGLPKFMRGFRDGLTKNFVDFMRVSREGLV